MLYGYTCRPPRSWLALHALAHRSVPWSVREPSAEANARIAEAYLDTVGEVKRFLQRRYGLSRADIDDACQELFVRLIKYEKRVTDIENPRAYMRRAAVNVFWNLKSSAARRFAHEPEWVNQLVADSAVEPERIVERSDEIRSIATAVEFLSARQRRFVELHFERGLSYNEIAVEAGVSPRTVLRELTRAYGKLREMIEPGRRSLRNSKRQRTRS